MQTLLANKPVYFPSEDGNILYKCTIQTTGSPKNMKRGRRHDDC